MKSLTKGNFFKQSKNKEMDYAAIYFRKNECKTRQCVYISHRIYTIISEIVRINSNSNVTIGGYIDNIIKKHLEMNKNEINELYNKELEKRNNKEIIDF